MSGRWKPENQRALIALLLTLALAGCNGASEQSSGSDAAARSRAAGERESTASFEARAAHEFLATHPQALVLDVRQPEEWDNELGHIEGARLVPLPELGGRLAEIEAWKTKPVIAVCRSGNRSGRAAELLRAAGFRDVYNLEGGMIGWRQAGY
jgi:rhodanese-related sulfurtransferase